MTKDPTNLYGVNELGMVMDPPPETTYRNVKNNKNLKQIMLRNTGNFIILDDDDWIKCRHVFWYEKLGKVVNQARFSLEEYLGLDPNKRKLTVPNKYDYRRKHYNA